MAELGARAAVFGTGRLAEHHTSPVRRKVVGVLFSDNPTHETGTFRQCLT